MKRAWTRRSRSLAIAAALVLFFLLIRLISEAQVFTHSQQNGKTSDHSGFITVSDTLIWIKEYKDTLEIFEVTKVSRWKGGIKLYKLEHQIYSGFLRVGYTNAWLEVDFIGLPKRTQIYFFRKE